MKRSTRVDGLSGDPDSSFEWEFETDAPGDIPLDSKDAHHPARTVSPQPVWQRSSPPDDQAGPPPDREQRRAPSPLAARYAGPDGLGRARLVMARLDAALERWWMRNELPARSLLREGLLVLEAGHALDEALRSLLLRAALYHGVGQATALWHQTDSERVALLMQEALLVWDPPLAPETVVWLAYQDRQGAQWAGPLIEALQLEAMTGVGDAPWRAREVLYLLDHAGADGFAPVGEPDAANGRNGARVRGQLAMALALAAVVAGFTWWQVSVRQPTDMVEVPAGIFVVRDPERAEGTRQVELDSFLIDRTEVTNRAYRRCLERGACRWPSSTDSATRANYLLDPDFSEYPVLNVAWDAAQAFCRWQGRRLPTAEEWEVAAGYAPATNRYYRYPWGQQFEAPRANSSVSGYGDTVAAGQYGTAGDSALGVSDMAGNVSEWTSTQVQADNAAGYVVKGGSYAGGPDELAVTAQLVLPADTARPEVGIRCARTLLLGQK